VPYVNLVHDAISYYPFLHSQVVISLNGIFNFCSEGKMVIRGTNKTKLLGGWTCFPPPIPWYQLGLEGSVPLDKNSFQSAFPVHCVLH